MLLLLAAFGVALFFFLRDLGALVATLFYGAATAVARGYGRNSTNIDRRRKVKNLESYLIIMLIVPAAIFLLLYGLPESVARNVSRFLLSGASLQGRVDQILYRIFEHDANNAKNYNTEIILNYYSRHEIYSLYISYIIGGLSFFVATPFALASAQNFSPASTGVGARSAKGRSVLLVGGLVVFSALLFFFLAYDHWYEIRPSGRRAYLLMAKIISAWAGLGLSLMVIFELIGKLFVKREAGRP